MQKLIHKAVKAVALCAMVVSTGCSLEVPRAKGGNLLSIKLEDRQQGALGEGLALMNSIARGFTPDFSVLADPSSASDINCFAVNVTGDGIAANAEKLAGCISNDNFTGRGIGIISDEVPRGSSVELDVPSGRDRYIDVYGVFPSNCGTPTGASGSSGDGAGYFLGRAIKDIGENTSVTIGITLTSNAIANKVTCPKNGTNKGFNDFIYIGGNGDIQAMSLSLDTGALTDLGTAAAGSGNVNAMVPASESAATNAKYVFFTNTGSGAIRDQHINPTTGVFDFSSSVSTPSAFPQMLTVSAQAGYIWGLDNSTAYAYSFNGSNGGMTLSSSTPLGSNHSYIAATPDGRFVLASNSSTQLHSYSVNSGNGALTLVDTATTNVSGLYMHPTGKFVYARTGSTTVAGFQINQTTGTLTAISGSPFTIGAGSIGDLVFNQVADYVYYSESGSNVSVQLVNPTTGALSSNGTYASPTVASLAVAASGKWLFVLESGTGDITPYPLNTNGTLGTALAVVPPSAGSSAVSITALRISKP